ncbi:hemerythrin domain-containing protein [Jannaschia sp. R86511]|uniref:hemerythrin domain-containing protein n=1 Tax=Jannaschia sp. R86511 TaxID=3093853 RepID=UPI0036D2D6D4
MPADLSPRDVVDVLTADHHLMLETAAGIRAATSEADKRELADLLIAELVRHSVAEELWVYPAMRRHLPDGDRAVDDDVAEHQELEVLLKRLEGVGPEDERFDVLVARLEGVLADHVRDEETDQFPQLRAAVPHEELVLMAERVEAVKQVAPTRAHPGAPNSALFHALAGPGVGLVDRLRDRLTGRPHD